MENIKKFNDFLNESYEGYVSGNLIGKGLFFYKSGKVIYKDEEYIPLQEGESLQEGNIIHEEGTIHFFLLVKRVNEKFAFLAHNDLATSENKFPIIYSGSDWNSKPKTSGSYFTPYKKK